MNRALRDAVDRRYWVWVTSPEFYLDDDGNDRADLVPRADLQPEGWWTCHRDTEEGDLALLYRSRIRKDLGYLMQALSGAKSLHGDSYAVERGWEYGCDYRVLARFTHPLTLEQMKADPALRDWGALRAGFRRKVYSIPPDTWSHLLDQLGFTPTKTITAQRRADRFYALERDIEDRLAVDLEPFARHGFNLKLLARQHGCCYGGRADLVCEDVDRQRCVVIELKRGVVTRDAAAQLLSYLASAQKDWPHRKRPAGVLVGDRLDGEAAGILKADARLSFIALEHLGFARST